MYNEAFGRSVKETDLPPGDRVVRRLQTLHGKYDHYKPAEALLRDPKKIDALSADTLANFESLIEWINATLD